MRERFARRQEGFRRQVALVREAILPLLPGQLGNARLDLSAHGPLVRRALHRHGRRIVDLPFQADRSQEVREQRGAVLRELQPDAVGRTRDGVGEEGSVFEALSARHPRRPGDQVVHAERVGQTGLEILAATAVPLPFPQRAEDSLQERHGGAMGGDRRSRKRGACAVEESAEFVHASTPRLHDRVIDRDVREGSARAEPAQRANHQLRCIGHQGFMRQAQALDALGLQAQQEDVRLANQRAGSFTTFVVRQVDDDAAFSPGPHRESGFLSQRAPRRRLEQQHFGPRVCEHHPGSGDGGARSHFDDPNSRRNPDFTSHSATLAQSRRNEATRDGAKRLGRRQPEDTGTLHRAARIRDSRGQHRSRTRRSETQPGSSPPPHGVGE